MSTPPILNAQGQPIRSALKNDDDVSRTPPIKGELPPPFGQATFRPLVLLHPMALVTAYQTWRSASADYQCFDYLSRSALKRRLHGSTQLCGCPSSAGV